MILDLLDSSLDGNVWEDLIIKCYRLRYQKSHFTPVPAKHRGDGGIEGFTKCGVVNQCYCPDDPNLSDDQLYEKQRDKMTKDIKKLTQPEYIEIYKKLGIKIINEWHYVVPEYKDKRIIEHANKKKLEVLEIKKGNPTLYDYLSDDFDIIIKVADDFIIELSNIIRKKVTNMKINLVFKHTTPPNWHECENEKINNVKRKLLAIQPELSTNNTELDELLDMYMTFYLYGIEQLEKLNESFPDIRKEILELIDSFKSEVKIKTLLNTNRTLNSELFSKLGTEFENNLRRDFDFLTNSSIMNLKNNIIASWLADCSMQFKGAN